MLVAKAAFENLKLDMEANAGEFMPKEHSGVFQRCARTCAQAITILNIAERRVKEEYDVVGDGDDE